MTNHKNDYVFRKTLLSDIFGNQYMAKGVFLPAELRIFALRSLKNNFSLSTAIAVKTRGRPVLTASWRGECKHAARCVISA